VNNLRRTAPAAPRMPVPRRTKQEGSGVTTVEGKLPAFTRYPLLKLVTPKPGLLDWLELL
jgi:hypothetical protein